MATLGLVRPLGVLSSPLLPVVLSCGNSLGVLAASGTLAGLLLRALLKEVVWNVWLGAVVLGLLSRSVRVS